MKSSNSDRLRADKSQIPGCSKAPVRAIFDRLRKSFASFLGSRPQPHPYLTEVIDEISCG
jgi:hypothetical protein